MTTTIELSDLSSKHLGKTITSNEGGVSYTTTLLAVKHEAKGRKGRRLVMPTTTLTLLGMGKRTYPSTKTIELHDEPAQTTAVSVAWGIMAKEPMSDSQREGLVARVASS